MENDLRHKMDMYCLRYVTIVDKQAFNRIYNLWVNNIVYEPQTIEEYKYIGLYYKFVLHNDDKAESYLLRGIKAGDGYCMYNMSMVCNEKGRIEEGQKYLEMALELRIPPAIEYINSKYISNDAVGLELLSVALKYRLESKY